MGWQRDWTMFDGQTWAQGERQLMLPGLNKVGVELTEGERKLRQLEAEPRPSDALDTTPRGDYIPVIRVVSPVPDDHK